jgi:GNAT superfamily N-acetyltransferase
MGHDAVQVLPVRTRADARAFLALPYRLYRNDPNWVAPLRREERRRWSPRHNSSLASRVAARFLARRGGRVAGRIAAIADPAFARRWGGGFFGFFECEDDDAAAGALFAAAERFLAGEQLDSVLGPVNLSTHEEVGFLVAGHDSPPMLLSPYNPPYYAALAECAGYNGAREYDAYLWTPQTQPAPVVDRLLRRLAVRGGDDAPRIRHLDPARWDAELRTIHALYNAAFAELWGYVPITWEELQAQANSFKVFYRPELVLIAEVGGEAVGFGLVLPDINAVLRPLHGRLLPFGLIRLARSVPRITTGRFILLGVRPEHTGRGVAALIAHSMAETARRLGLTQVELSLVQGGNEQMRHVIDAFAAPRIKTYRLYQKSL